MNYAYVNKIESDKSINNLWGICLGQSNCEWKLKQKSKIFLFFLKYSLILLLYLRFHYGYKTWNLWFVTGGTSIDDQIVGSLGTAYDVVCPTTTEIIILEL